MLGRVKDVVGVYEGFLVGSSVAVLLAGYYEEDPFAAIGQSATKDVLTDQCISMRTRLPKPTYCMAFARPYISATACGTSRANSPGLPSATKKLEGTYFWRLGIWVCVNKAAEKQIS